MREVTERERGEREKGVNKEWWDDRENAQYVMCNEKTEIKVEGWEDRERES